MGRYQPKSGLLSGKGFVTKKTKHSNVLVSFSLKEKIPGSRLSNQFKENEKMKKLQVRQKQKLYVNQIIVRS